MNYEICLPIIKKKTIEFHRKSGIDYEEIKSEANVIFAECVKTFEKEKGSFFSYLKSQLHYKLMYFTKNENKEKHNMYDSYGFFEEREPIWFFIDSLSDKSQNIVHHIFNSNPCSHTGKITKSSLSSFLSNIGWKRQDILYCFQEISKKIKKENNYVNV